MKVSISENYKDIQRFNRLTYLKKNGLRLLKETIEEFFNCEIEFHFEPTKEAKEKFGLDILEQPNRGCYPLDQDNFYIFARIIEANVLISGLGIKLTGKYFSKNVKFLNSFEGALSGELSQGFLSYFEYSTMKFGSHLILHAINNFCIRGYIDYRRFYHLIDYFQNLKNTTFEGESFSTGLIITKSFHAFKENSNEKRFGKLYHLKERVSIKDTLKIDRRFWYLADGKHCFYVSNKNLAIDNIFILDDDYEEIGYIDNHSLSLTLKGGDTLFKIENEKSFSIINSDGTEFLCLENKWRIRNYNIIIELLSSVISNHDVINRLLFYILFCSKNSISSVLWIPIDIETVDKLVKPDTLNRLIEEPLSIMNNRFTNHIIRYISSDGASIIDKEGNLQYFGSIVDMKNLEIKGVKGTGESAAKVLSENGISIKISQDGTIKLFLDPTQKAVIL